MPIQTAFIAHCKHTANSYQSETQVKPWDFYLGAVFPEAFVFSFKLHIFNTDKIHDAKNLLKLFMLLFTYFGCLFYILRLSATSCKTKQK